MSHPYVIWTMRRTGGTTLATLLSRLSEHAGIQHEPFNRDRMLGHITEAFAQTNDLDALRVALYKNLESRPLIKHCYELMSEAFNAVFLEVTTALGYQHVVLDRRNEADRVVSLELAYLTGAWGGDAAQDIYPAIEAGEIVLEAMNTKRALNQMGLCRSRRKELATMTIAAVPAPFVVYFEDVYNDPDEGRKLIQRLLDFLEIKPEDHTNYDSLVDDALLKRGQNSARILQAVPNAQVVLDRLEAEHRTQDEIFTAS